ncbi:NAD(+) diphosphatase [Clostridium sp.]|uniref:NAD(+) diphosphatase n=1 Tax=Clostridium sp. TaxID=1506 RepID=UPI003216E7C6
MNHLSIENTNTPSWFIFRQNELLVKEKKDRIFIPKFKDLESININPIRVQNLGTRSCGKCYSVEVSQEYLEPLGMKFISLRNLYGQVSDEIYIEAGRAIQIMNWDRTHQYCGVRGSSTNTISNEYGKICPQCGFISYPRISPAIIVAIVKEGKILLAKNAKSKHNFYSVLAGFLEPGETLEQCVEREVMEEVGIEVKNIKYFGNQPWPFPNSLMIGFTAEYDKGEIEVDGVEIAEANWFEANNLPNIPGNISIARKLIDWFKENYTEI